MYFTWKARVVCSLLVCFVLTVNASRAQSAHASTGERKITLSVHQEPFEDVLNQLAQKSAVSFVYSSSVIDLKKTISLTVYNQSLEDVLKEIARQANVSFSREGDHIVLKKQVALPPLKAKVNTKSATELLSPTENNTINTLLASLSAQPFAAPSQKSVYDFSPGLLENDSVLSKKAAKIMAKIQLQLSKTIDTKKHNHLNARWFASAGFIVNDYSLDGIEVKGGHRSLFAVVNASHLDNKRYRVGYGAGTSFPLSSTWNLQAIYTVANITKDADFAVIKNALKFDSWHHQVKLVAQYALSPRITVHGGITGNLLNTRYKFLGIDVPADIPLVYRSMEPAHREVRLSLSEVIQSSSTISAPYTISNTYSDNNYRNTQTWIGFDAGVSYQLNFFTRR